MRILIRILTISVAFAAFCVASNGQNLSEIVKAYGGIEGTRRLENFTAQGDECVVLPPQVAGGRSCVRFKQYRDSTDKWRMDTQDDAIQTQIVTKDVGVTFIDGTWIQLVRATLAGEHREMLSRGDIDRFWRHDSISFPGFLEKISEWNLVDDGLTESLDGTKARAYSVRPWQTVAVRFLFDQSTNLCIQYDQTRAAHDVTHVVLRDYRVVDELPVPFVRRFYYNETLTREWIFRTVLIGSPPASAFDAPR